VTQIKMLKIPAVGCLAAALTSLLVAPVSAQILTKSSGSYQDQLSRCSTWWECYKQQQIEKDKAAEPTFVYPTCVPLVTAPFVPVPLVIQLPNLIPTDVDARFYASSLAIKAQVDNVGEVDAQGFDFRAEVTFIRMDSTFYSLAMECRRQHSARKSTFRLFSIVRVVLTEFQPSCLCIGSGVSDTLCRLHEMFQNGILKRIQRAVRQQRHV
jgi:hypothetical protein